MQKFSTLSDVVALAEFAHRNQTDKAGMPYIEHPRRVMRAVQAQGAMPYVQMAAILHDVTEDTAFTPQMLLDLGVPETAVEIVKLLDRNHSRELYYSVGGLQDGPEEEWPAWVWYVARHSVDEFYYWQIRQNPGATQVKLADIGDNLQPWRLSYLPEGEQEYLKHKYANALEMLR